MKVTREVTQFAPAILGDFSYIMSGGMYDIPFIRQRAARRSGS
jgi:hypothetical protein